MSIVPTLEWFIQFSIDVESRMNLLERLMVRLHRSLPVGRGRAQTDVLLRVVDRALT